MSPAARKLATKHLLSPRLKLTPHDMGILSHARTPTPRRRPAPSRGPTPSKRGGTPLVLPTAQGAASPAATHNNITDNLLQINVAKRTRLKAQDFFEGGVK